MLNSKIVMKEVNIRRNFYQTPKLELIRIESEDAVMIGSGGGASFSLHGQLHGTGAKAGAW